jgi:hypothetical protein
MPFVKLDCGILDSSLWVDREAREVFITALLMAKPYELKEPSDSLDARSMESTGIIIPSGQYGIVEAAGSAVIRRAGIDMDAGWDAIDKLCNPDPESRTAEFGGRRLARIDGGYLVLNFQRYRDKDHTSAERARKYRESKLASRSSRRDDRDASRKTGCVTRDITQAEAEAEAEADSETQKDASAPFSSPQFKTAWQEWEQHRREIRKKLTPTTRKRQLEQLGAMSEADAIESIRQSVANGWTGLFEPKGKTSSKNNHAGIQENIPF